MDAAHQGRRDAARHAGVVARTGARRQVAADGRVEGSPPASRSHPRRRDGAAAALADVVAVGARRDCRRAVQPVPPPEDRDRRVSPRRSRRADQIRHRDLPARRAGARARLPRPPGHRRGGVGCARGRRRFRDARRRARAHAAAALESREVDGRIDRVHRLRRAGRHRPRDVGGRRPPRAAALVARRGAGARRVVAGFIETAPIRLNDNISVPAAAALVLVERELRRSGVDRSRDADRPRAARARGRDQPRRRVPRMARAAR